jgi:hypothetical protein
MEMVHRSVPRGVMSDVGLGRAKTPERLEHENDLPQIANGKARICGKSRKSTGPEKYDSRP